MKDKISLGVLNEFLSKNTDYLVSETKLNMITFNMLFEKMEKLLKVLDTIIAQVKLDEDKLRLFIRYLHDRILLNFFLLIEPRLHGINPIIFDDLDNNEIIIVDSKEWEFHSVSGEDGDESNIREISPVVYKFQAHPDRQYKDFEDEERIYLIRTTFDFPFALLSLFHQSFSDNIGIIVREIKEEMNIKEVIVETIEKDRSSRNLSNRDKFVLQIKEALSNINGEIKKKDVYEYLGIVRTTFDSQLSKYDLLFDQKNGQFIDQKTNLPI